MAWLMGFFFSIFAPADAGPDYTAQSTQDPSCWVDNENPGGEENPSVMVNVCDEPL